MEKFDAVIILGGGRYNNGELTPLSLQRVEKGLEVYNKEKVPKIIVLGEYYSTYFSNALKYDKTGAQLRKEYLVKRGINPKDIIIQEEGRDTICEAFAAREKVKKLGYKKVIIVTSDKHMDRALWVFRRIFGKDIAIEGNPVPCNDLLIADEEKEYFKSTKEFFRNFPQEIPSPNIATWIETHKELYTEFKKIHDKYHPKGKESQAYMGIIDSD